MNMLFIRLRRFFCTRAGALHLRPAACRKREESAIFSRLTAASFASSPAKTSEAKPNPPFNACLPIAFALDLINGIIDFARLEKIPPKPYPF